MHISPWLELGTSVVLCTQVGIALTFPFLVDAFVDDFSAETFYTWMRYQLLRLIPQAMLLLSSIIGVWACLSLHNTVFLAGLLLNFLSSGLCSFLLIFSSQSPTYALCDGEG